MKNNIYASILLTTAISVALSACSGGGTGSDDNQAPNSNIDTPSSNMRIDVGETIEFSATSTDPDGHVPLAYRWSFGNGSGIPDATSEDPGSVKFDTEGVYTVNLTVTDSLGLADPTPATRVITVGNQAPDGSIDTPLSDSAIHVGESIEFTATASDPDGDEPLSYLWTFGSGSGIPDSSNEDPGLVQFNNEGTYTVTLTVTDSLERADPTPATRTITVGNQAPDGVIISPGADLTINTGNSLNFTASGSDPEGDLPLSYLWDFGSGSGIPDAAVKDPGSVTFNNEGTFTVTLTVTDSLGLADPVEDVRVITVKPADSDPLPKSGWSLLSVNSEEIVAEDGAATNAFDDDDNTIWHSQYFPSSDPHPHDIRISLGGTYQVSGFRQLPRQDGSNRGRIKNYKFYVSLDGNSWNLVKSGTFSSSFSEKEVLLSSSVQAAYVRLASSSDHNNENLTAVAEITLLGDLVTANQAPIGAIDSPSKNTIVNQFDTVSFDGNATDFENNIPFSYLWDFGSGSGIADATIEDPVVQFNNAGTFDISLIVSDSRGVADPTPAVRSIEVCVPPSSSIISPQTKHLQTATTLTVDAHACLDSGSHTGWGLKIKLKDSLGSLISTVNDTKATFSSLPKDEYIIQTTVINQTGSEVSGTTTSVSQIGIGNYYVAVGDSITVGLKDNISSDDVSNDGRNNSGGYTPILNDKLSSFTNQPHTVINRGVAGDSTVEGINLIDSIIADNPDAQYFLIQYGTNDAGSSPLDKSTFKSNMQLIINKVKNAGKQPYLAKAPYAKGAFSARNTLIQQYNQAIDELIASNNISVSAPDFYNYFLNHQSEFGDDLHPNGTGYQSMADLWFNELK